MKKLFTSVLCFFTCVTVNAQSDCAFAYDISFDSANIFYYLEQNYSPVTHFDTSNVLDYSGWLHIDTINYHHNQWQIGKPNKRLFDSSYTRPNAIITDTVNSCSPNDTSAFILKYPGNCTTSNTMQTFLSFKYRLDIDSGDVAKIEFSNDSGATWATADSNFVLFFPASTLLSDSTKGWQNCIIYPPYGYLYPSDTVLVRFTLITGSDTAQRDGWMIDSLTMAYRWYEGVENVKNDMVFQLYPNPADNKVKIELTNALNNGYRMTVVNAVGMRVFADKIPKGSTSYMLQVRDWDKGVYFIELDDGKRGRAVKKLVVE